MKLKLSYKTKEEIPDWALENGLYTEKNGEWFFIGVDGMKSEEDIKRIQDSLQKERNDHKDTKAKLKAFNELEKTPEELAEIEQELSEVKIKLDETHKTDEEKLNQLVEAKSRPLQKKIKDLEAERDQNKQEAESANRKST